MSKEAMKLALEALEFIPQSGSMLGSQAETKRLQAIAVMKEALVMQQLSEPCRCGKQTNVWCMANTCSKAQQALDKKAENARELGLDYEPAQQEPVAFKIYKPTPPRHATPNVRDAELPWVYDQDPSSGNVASMWVTPVQTLMSKK
jgi:hypothetical protein